MAVAIGASGIMGIALEVTSGTYVAPTKFFPFESESLGYVQDTFYRRPIRNTPGLIGAVPGNVHIEGEISIEALPDVIPYFLKAARTVLVKTGASAPYTYAFTPGVGAVPVNTMSISVKRNNEVMGYTGCVVSSFTLTIGTDGQLKFNVQIVGSNESTQSALTPVWPSTLPFGAGMYKLEIPTSTQVFDTDTFEFTVEDNAEPQYRLNDTTRGANFVKFGESAATINVARDFHDRADYDAFKALTAQSITLTATQGVDSTVIINAPVAIKDTYEVAIPSQGDLVRASVSYQCAINAAGNHYALTVTTTENIT